MVQQLGKISCTFFIKVNIDLPYDLAVLLLGVYPRQMKHISTEQYSTIVTITDLFIIT